MHRLNFTDAKTSVAPYNLYKQTVKAECVIERNGHKYKHGLIQRTRWDLAFERTVGALSISHKLKRTVLYQHLSQIAQSSVSLECANRCRRRVCMCRGIVVVWFL